MMRKISTQSVAILLLIITSFPLAAVEYLDGIVAVVEDDIILESELAQEVASVVSNLKANNVQMPPEDILYKQVLERLIIGMLQTQLAAKAGVKVTDEMLDNTLSGIAQQNGMDLISFKQQIEAQGMSYETFKENVRKEIVINQLRNHEIGSRVKVSEQEIDHYLETE
ncbi:MAG: molecular chaperone SurA, partial [Gammaproteobacteria bacterium]|nr:molecular chaperone SurA [Gammaproteobacteria bacterium]